MGTNRRRRSSAGMPTVRMSAEPRVYTASQERTPPSRRMQGLIALNLLVVVVAASIVVWALTRSAPPSAVASSARVVQGAETSTPSPASAVAEPSAMAASAVESPGGASPTATIAPAPAVTQPAASAAQAPTTAQLTSGSPQNCTPVPGVTLFANAVCIEYETDQDDGILEHDNTYVVAAAADDVRRFFESTLVQDGWTITESSHDVEDREWEYEAMQGLRELNVEVETRQGPNESFTQFRVAED